MGTKITTTIMTKAQREKNVRDAYSMSCLGGIKPSERTMQHMQEYIEGKKTLSDVREELLSEYREA